MESGRLDCLVTDAVPSAPGTAVSVATADLKKLHLVCSSFRQQLEFPNVYQYPLRRDWRQQLAEPADCRMSAPNNPEKLQCWSPTDCPAQEAAE